MSSSADEAVINPFGGSFVPKKKVNTMIGRTSLSLYPDIQPHMTTSERGASQKQLLGSCSATDLPTLS